MRKRATSVHRPGSLKAVNKAHKSGRHKSNRSLKKVSQGKVSKKVVPTRKATKLLTKAEKKNRSKMLRAVKLGSKTSSLSDLTAAGLDPKPLGAPLLIAVVPMSPQVSVPMLKALVKGADVQGRLQHLSASSLRLNSSKLKTTFQFQFTQPKTELLRTLDVLKVSDAALLVFDRDAELPHFQQTLSVLFAHGLPSAFPITLAASSSLKERKMSEKLLARELREKFSLPADVQAVQSPADVLQLLRKISAKTLSKPVFGSKRCHGLSDKLELLGTDKVRMWTFLRGETPGVSVGDCLHLPGFADFKVVSLSTAEPPDEEGMEVEGTADRVESFFDDEVADDAEMEEAEDKEDEEARPSRKELDEVEFPDEVDTPKDVVARVRFSKYRLVDSLQSSVWEAFEDLPDVFSRLVYFANFQHTRNRVIKLCRTAEHQVAGGFVRMDLQLLPGLGGGLPDAACGPVAWFRLLEHEEKLTQVNCTLQLTASSRNLKNKEPLDFIVGWRRFRASPVFSEHNLNNSKHLVLKQLQPGVTAAASFFAPLTYTPAPVLCFKDGLLAASGSLLSCDPARLNIKRTILSGHPFKVHKRSAVVRYMFFNPEDVTYFQSGNLRTKSGRRGKVIEPVGTHGLMKCSFDGQVTNMDTVLMDLFKRQFPKFSYSPLNFRLTS